jgi:electron transport complex protein RnfD
MTTLSPPPVASGEPAPAAVMHISPAPHLADGLSTRRIMFEVVAAMLPLFGVAIWLFRWNAVLLTLVTTAGCLLAEAVANWARGRSQRSLTDGSAIVTGMILAFSLPPSMRLYQAFIGGGVAIGLGKAIFGGLGQNLFNPAMVGRAFLMICFPVAMTTWAEPHTLATVGLDAVTQATPLAAAKYQSAPLAALSVMVIGNEPGSVGETSALAVLVGGLYLLIRRIADWRQPVAMLATAAVFAAIAHAVVPERCAPVGYHLAGGALLFGAFFIATDYAGAPVTPSGRLIFGAGAGLLVMVIRVFGGYPEGVMYAILIMNALTPLIERWTQPVPLGGHATA